MGAKDIFKLWLKAHYAVEFLHSIRSLPTFGADNISHFGLTVDLKRRKLIYTVSNFESQCVFKNAAIDVSSIDKTSSVSYLLNKYPEILGPSQSPAFLSQEVHHNIVTSGPHVWPGMNKVMKKWCRVCMHCQKTKVSRHTTILPSHFEAPESRFRHVHMDIVGPFPDCDAYRYLLTMIDRFSRWPEAVPLKDIEALTIYRAFVDSWISRFGSPETLSTDLAELGLHLTIQLQIV